MANGGTRSQTWQRFDEKTRLDLAINELDQVYGRIDTMQQQSSLEHSQIRQEFTQAIAAVKGDFHERIDALRTEVREGFEKMEKRDARKTALFYAMISGILVGLALMVATLASR